MSARSWAIAPHATLRWVRADLRARRVQAILTVAVVAGVVAALLLAAMLLEGTTNPWQGLFARTHGADVMIRFGYGTDLAKLDDLTGVTRVGTPSTIASATLEQGATEFPVELRAMRTSEPAISAPLVTEGSWLRASDGAGHPAGPANAAAPAGAVVEASFAAATNLRVGMRVNVVGVDGNTAAITVVGLAYTADQDFYPQATPGLIWVLPATLQQVEKIPSETEEVVGLRVADPSANGVGQVVQEVYNAYHTTAEASPVEQVATSQQVDASMASNDRLLGLLLGLFGIIALIAALYAIANVTAGRVLVQRRDIAMLGALGFTPGQVVWALLIEQTALGVAASAVGLAVAWAAIRTPAFIGPPDGIPVALTPLPALWMALAAAVTVATVAVATVVPAWRAGRVSPVAAVAATPPRGRLSRLARVGLLVRLPVPLVLGARDAFTRRLPAALTIVGVAIPMAMITIAMTCWTTLDGFTSDPGRIDLAAALTVYPGSESIHAEQAQLARDPQIAADYPGAEFDTLLPGATATFTARAVGTSSRRYPFDVVQGAMFNSYNEAIAGQGLLDLLHYNVGDWIEVTVDGVPMIFQIVGRTLDPDNNGDVLDFGLDALSFNGAADQPQFYSLVLKPGVDPAAARQQLLRQSGNRLQVQQAANPSDGLGVVRVVIVIAIVALAIIGLANLLTATAVGLGDHLHEAEVLAAIGLTPRQVMATLVVNTTILTAFGAAVGTAAGLAVAPLLVNAQGQASGLGWGIAVMPSAGVIAAMLALTLLVATAAALLLALRAARAPEPLTPPRRPLVTPRTGA
jgi:putative ABC transport system permease protein